MIIDYTTYAEGTAISRKGAIHRCPVCNRMGERQRRASKSRPWVFVHRAKTTHTVTGTKLEIIEKCLAASAGDAPVAEKPTQMVLGR